MHTAGTGAERTAIILLPVTAAVVGTCIIAGTYLSLYTGIYPLRNGRQGKHVKAE